MDYQEELYMKLRFQADEIIATLPGFCKKYFTHLLQTGASIRTRLQYSYDMKNFFEFVLSAGGFDDLNLKTCTASDILDRLNNDDIQDYIASLEFYEVMDKNGKKIKKLSSPALRARRVSSLRSFYKYYFRMDEIKNNLADKMDVPAIPEKSIVIMDKEDVKRVLAAIKDVSGLTEGQLKRHSKIVERDYAIMMLFLGTGIRVSELVGINMADVDYYNASIMVTRKGGDQDEVFFGPEVENALLDYDSAPRDTLLAGNTEEQALFISMHHKRLTTRQVENMVKSYAQKAGLNIDLHPHSLRKTFGTNLYEQTGDIYLVADALHHSSVETTKKHYAKMSKEHKRIAAKQSSTLFEND